MLDCRNQAVAILVNKRDLMSVYRDKHVLSVACMVAAGFLARPSVAQDESQSPSAGEPIARAISVTIGDNIIHDSNQFKVPATANPQSESTNIAYIKLSLDKLYSLQRFQVDITDTVRTYDKFSYLNFKALDYRAAWLWQLTSRLTGSLSTNRTETLVPFQDTLGTGNTQRNVRATEAHAFNLDGWLAGNWHLLLGANQNTQTSEQGTTLQPDSRSVSREAGIKYAPGSSNTVTVTRRTTDGEYLNQAFSSKDYNQQESEVSVSWKPSSKSTLTGLLRWHTRTQSLGSRSGLNGNFGYTWIPTGKLSVNFVAARTITPNLDAGVGDRVLNTLSVATTWATSAKSSARLNFSRASGSFAGGATNASSTDTLDTVLLAANWTPIPKLSLGATVQRQIRVGSSSSPTSAVSGFNDTTATLTGSLKF